MTHSVLLSTCIAANRVDERRISMKSLPSKPNLEFLKKDAKALRTSHRRGDRSSCERIRLHNKTYKKKTDAEILVGKFSINDAQRIVAREYGYTSWATMKEYIESLDSLLYKGVADVVAYHESVAESFDKRSSVYDNHVWAREWSLQLVDLFPPRAEEHVLDIACGTGPIAFSIVERVGNNGSVTGVDISPGMINRCQEKLTETNFTNLRFVVGDAELLDFPMNSFDRMYCSAGLPWLINPQAALHHWFELLKTGGWIALTVWPSNSFVWGDGERKALRKYGIVSTVHEFSGTKEKVYKLMELAGFSNISIHVVERGQWIEAASLKGPFNHAAYSPGQYPHPLKSASEEILKKAQKDYEAEVDRLTTEQGVWHDMTTFFVCAQKTFSL
jgi:ubiquinone/menaquinone biosynthesis C-methylase UbiE